MMNKRSLLSGAGGALAGAALAKLSLPFVAYADDATILPFANGERPLARYPGKRPLICLTSRPPQLETPFAVFNESVITPNDARIDVPLDDFAEVLAGCESVPSMLVADVDRHLECLPAGQRKVVRAVAVDGASISEAAARLSMTNGAVRVALHRD